MLSKSTELFSKSVGLKLTDNNSYGIYNDYFLTVSEKRNARIIEISCFLGDGEENSISYLTVSDCIKDNLSKYRISDYELGESEIRIVSSAELTLLREMLDTVLGILKDNDVHGAEYCSRCGEPFSPAAKKKIVSIGDKRSLLCDNCTFEIMEENREPAVDETAVAAAKPSLWRTLAGALIGGIIGFAAYAGLFAVIPTGDIGIIRYIVCLMGFVTGILTFFGAKLLASGKFGKATVWCVSCVSAVLTVAAHYIGCVIYNIQLYSWAVFKFNPAPFFRIVFSQNLTYFAAGSVIAVCAVAVSLIFLMSSEMKKKEEIHKVNVSVESLKN